MCKCNRVWRQAIGRAIPGAVEAPYWLAPLAFSVMQVVQQWFGSGGGHIGVQFLQFRGVVVDAHLVICRRRGWVGVSAGARNRSASAAVTSAMTVSHAP